VEDNSDLALQVQPSQLLQRSKILGKVINYALKETQFIQKTCSDFAGGNMWTNLANPGSLMPAAISMAFSQKIPFKFLEVEFMVTKSS